MAGMESLPFVPTVVKVTPEIATDWLDNRNLSENRPFNNRSVSTHIVDKYAEIMADGRWMLTHQGIAFDREGWLVDGQHRLKAVIVSGVAVELLVTPDCDPGTFAVLDTGFSRQASQLIPVNGGVISPAARIVGTVTGAWPMRSITAGIYDTQATNDQILMIVDQWPELELLARSVSTCYQKTRINKPAHLAILAQAARNGHQEKFPGWFKALETGEDLAAQDPRLHLRNRFLRESRELNSGVGRGTTYRLIVRAWNAHVRSKPVGVLRAREDLPPPEVA